MRAPLVSMVTVAMLAGACGPDPAPAPPAIPAPDASALLQRHRTNAEAIPTLAANGVVEVRWEDSQGRHFEQGDLDVRFRRPDEFALQVKKAGERFLLVGCDATRSWVFEPAGKPSRLTVAARHPDRGSGPTVDRLPVNADVLLVLFGLTPLGESAGPATWDADRKAWRIDIAAEKSALHRPVRAWFGDSELHLLVLEAIDSQGAAIVRAELERYESVELKGAAPGAWPRVATRIRVTAPARGERGEHSWLAAFESPNGTGERIRDGTFDLDALRKSLNPQAVDDETSPGATRAGEGKSVAP